MIFVRSTSRALGAVGLLLLVGCGTNSAIEESRDFARLGDYLHAYEVIDAARDEQLAAGEVDPDVAEWHEAMRRKFLYSRAQSRIFGEKEDFAIRDLALLEQADPDFPGLEELKVMARRKQAMRVTRRADEHLTRNEYAEAMKAYLESERLVPGFEPAQAGMTAVRDELARMDARAQQQFLQAVRKVPEFRHVEVAWHSAAVIDNKLDPDDEQRKQAERMQEEARRASALDSLQRARACAKDGQFGAAMLLYREAEQAMPELPEVKEAIAQMKRELKALGLLEKAQLEMRSNNLDEAAELLERALELTTASRDTIVEAQLALDERRAVVGYRAARDLEVMGKKAEALAAYESIVDMWSKERAWPEEMENPAARIMSLKVDIAGAEEEWAAAEAAEAEGNLQEALDHYVRAERFYDQWRDGEVHIARLRAAIAAREAEKTSEAEPAGGSEQTPGAGGGGS